MNEILLHTECLSVGYRKKTLTGGTEYLGGKDMSALREQDVARQMSVLMTGRIHPELITCFDVAATGRYPYTGRLGILSREDHEKTAQCLELVHAAELADQDFSQISDRVVCVHRGVIGGGAGIPVYRRLQRQGIPFAAGVLGRGDLDYPVARTLAVEIVEEGLFQPIGDEAFRRAVSVMERCGKVLCPVEVFGEMSQKTGSSGRLPRRPENCSAVSGRLGSSVSTSAPLAIGFFFSPCRMFFHNPRTSD